MEAALVGALISGVAMYAVGARAQNDVVTETPFVAAAQPVAARAATSSRFVVERVPVSETRAVQTAPAAAERPAGRSWKKSALIIGGAAASGAGVGGIVNGKKGALIGAAVGGGAASIYEATRR
jgi:hypothetical protein